MNATPPCDPSASPGLPGRRRTLRAVSLALPALAGVSVLQGCAVPGRIAPPPGAEPLAPPVIRVGDFWRYRLTDRYSGSILGETRVDVVRTEPDLQLRVDPGDGREPREERYTAPWTVAVESIYGLPMLFETPVPVVPAGARTGTVSTVSTRYTAPGASRPLFWTQRLRVVGWERVTVPAGEFDALRIDRVIQFEHPDLFRLAPERTDVAWYSPRAGRWVAREWTGDFMPGAPTPRFGRARDDWVRWELTGWQTAAR